jgi:hypothetical protein
MASSTKKPKPKVKTKVKAPPVAPPKAAAKPAPKPGKAPPAPVAPPPPQRQATELPPLYSFKRGLGGPRSTRYPWEQWFKDAVKGPVTLVRGRHYECLTHGMARNIIQAAVRCKLKVNIQQQEGSVTFRIKGITPGA